MDFVSYYTIRYHTHGTHSSMEREGSFRIQEREEIDTFIHPDIFIGSKIPNSASSVQNNNARTICIETYTQ